MIAPRLASGAWICTSACDIDVKLIEQGADDEQRDEGEDVVRRRGEGDDAEGPQRGRDDCLGGVGENALTVSCTRPPQIAPMPVASSSIV